MEKGPCCCQYQRGGLKRSTCSPRRFCSTALPSPGRTESLGETCSSFSPRSQNQQWHLFPGTCSWMEPSKNAATKCRKFHHRAFAFRQQSMFAKRWTLKARTIVAQRGLAMTSPHHLTARKKQSGTPCQARLPLEPNRVNRPNLDLHQPPPPPKHRQQNGRRI